MDMIKMNHRYHYHQRASSSQDAEKLMSKYTVILTQASCCNYNSINTSLSTYDNNNIRFMEKIMLTEATHKRPRVSKRIFNSPGREYQFGIPCSQSTNQRSNPHRIPDRSIKQKLILPLIKTNRVSSKASPIKVTKTTATEPNVKDNQLPKINKKEKLKQSTSNTKGSLHRHSVDKPNNLLINNKKIDSSRQLIKMGIINTMRRNKEKLNTISYNPYLRSLVDANREDKTPSLITDSVMKSLMQSSDEGKSTNYLLSFDKVLNIKAFSVHGAFEGKGPEASFLASYSKNIISSLVTQSLTYDFKSSLINSKTIYLAITKNDHEVLRELWEKLKELMTISSVDLNANSISFSLLFVIGSKVIAMSYGKTQAIALENKIDRDREQFLAISLANKVNSNNELTIDSYLINDDTINIVIGTSNMWNESRPYYNVLRVMSLTQIELKEKAELLIQCKRKQAMSHGGKANFGFIILCFS